MKVMLMDKHRAVRDGMGGTGRAKMSKGTWQKLFPVVAVLWLSMAALAACGKPESGAGIGGYVYQAEVLAEKVGRRQMSQLKLYGGFLYYMQSGQNTGIRRLQADGRMDPAGGETVLGETSGLRDYAAGPDGAFYYVAQKYASAWDGSSGTECVLARMGAGAGDSWEVSLPGVRLRAQYGSYGCLETDRDGRIFLLAEGGIYCVDADGGVSDIIPAENYRLGGAEGLLRGEDGRLYYYSSSNSGRVVQTVCEITGGGKFHLEKIPDCTAYVRKLCGSERGLLCFGDDGVLYQYRRGESAWVQVLRWADSDLGVHGASANEIVQTGEGSFIALLDDIMSDDAGTLYLMTRRAASDLPEKERLVLAAIRYQMTDELIYRVSKFNQSSDRYRIDIECYEYGEVSTRLNARLVSQNPPDLVLADGLDVAGYAEKQIFEDLAPYVDGSGVLDRGDFFGKIWDGYTIGGRLAGIPGGFGIQAVMGRASHVGEEAGWTMDGLMALTEEHPGMRLVNSPRETMLQSIVSGLGREYVCRRYVNWETGECFFDGEDFRRFMEWLKTYLDGFYAAYGDDYDQYGKDMYSKDTLLYAEEIVWLRDLAWWEMGVGEKVTAIGVPTPDGSPYVSVKAYNVLCIPARSARKEGAWEFMEYFLSQEDPPGQYFPTRQDVFRRMLEEETTPEYILNEKGEISYGYVWGKPMTPENYAPILKTKAVFTDWEGNEVPYKYMSQEQADQLLELLDAADFTPAGGVCQKVTEVVLEEIGAYVNGSREAEDVADIIQNRVKNLVEERMTGR